MKKILLALIIASALLGGCVSVSIGGGTGAGGLRGTGDMVTIPVETGSFNGIDISGGYTIVYRHAPQNALTVVIQQNLFERMDFSVENDVLRISSDVGFNTTPANIPRLYVYSPALELVALSGAAELTGDAISANTFTLVTAGASDVTLELDVGTLTVTLAGAASLELSGQADTLSLTAAGASDVRAGALSTRIANIDVSGAGNVIVAASELLDATITGAGSVRYIGDPQVSYRTFGAGSVSRVG